MTAPGVPGVPGEVIARPSARVLVIDESGRVLLLAFRFRPDDTTITWLTPGGGINPGETPAEAAARELAEEVGIEVTPDQLGLVVAVSSGRWRSAAGQLYDAHDSYFLFRARENRLDFSRQEDLERSLIAAHRWWPLDELRTCPDQVMPPGLPDFLPGMLAGDPPRGRLRLPWH